MSEFPYWMSRSEKTAAAARAQRSPAVLPSFEGWQAQRARQTRQEQPAGMEEADLEVTQELPVIQAGIEAGAVTVGNTVQVSSTGELSDVTPLASQNGTASGEAQTAAAMTAMPDQGAY